MLMGLMHMLLVSCSDDDNDFVYPDLLNEFVEFCTDSKGTVSKMTNDAGWSWSLDPIKELTELVPDTVYRVVVKYVSQTADGNDKAVLYSSQGVIAPIPISISHFKNVITDPVRIQSIWKGGDYINIILNVLVKDKSHKFHFIENGFSPLDDGSGKKLSLTLYHDRNADIEAFYRTVYLSVPLWYYKNVIGAGDKIEVSINTYNDGVVKTTFDY